MVSLPAPPKIPLPRTTQKLHFSVRQIEYLSRWQRQLGDTFWGYADVPNATLFISHPDHAKSLFTAKPSDAPSTVGESPMKNTWRRCGDTAACASAPGVEKASARGTAPAGVLASRNTPIRGSCRKR